MGAGVKGRWSAGVTCGVSRGDAHRHEGHGGDEGHVPIRVGWVGGE